MNDAEGVARAFSAIYGSGPSFVARAPGRVNLIGEHTDYNDGFVFPVAISHDVTIAGRARNDRRVRLRSALYGQHSEFSLDALSRARRSRWTNYVRGVADILQQEGFGLCGMDAIVTGTVPLSSGLSSSAAFEVAACLALERVSGFELPPVKRALLCQRAEREFVGVQCGIMDQFISALGRADHALFIDTRSLEHEDVPLPATGVSIVIGNTNRQRGLVDSEYNRRREECEAAVEALRPARPGIRALRDVALCELEAARADLPPVVFRRARHVITENERVMRSVPALKAGDVALFGQLMNESHDSLRDDYEVSCPELDAMVSAARRAPGVYGSRMTGAGFGGCTVSLVASNAVGAFQGEVGAAYASATQRQATFYVCKASQGATLSLL
jgi:galactokinase